MCISVYTVYRYLVSRYVYSVSKYIQIQSAGADNRQVIKSKTDTVRTGSRDGHRRELDTMSTHRRALEGHRRRLEGV